MSSLLDPESADGRSSQESFNALWSRVLERWEDDRAHTAIVELALRTGELPELAGRYRALANDPQRGAVAKRQLDAVVGAATTLLWSTKTPAPGKVPVPMLLSAAGICLVLLAWLAWTLFPQP